MSSYPPLQPVEYDPDLDLTSWDVVLDGAPTVTNPHLSIPESWRLPLTLVCLALLCALALYAFYVDHIDHQRGHRRF